jgi:hypothetical protein
MSGSDAEDKPPSKRQQREALKAVRIYTTPATTEGLALMARDLIKTTRRL